MRSLVAYWPVTLIVIGLPVIAAILYGCERRPVVEISESNKETGEKCAALLESGINSVRPDGLGLLSVESLFKVDPQDAADRLSQWLRRPDCREAVPTEPLSPAAKQRITSLLGSDGVAQVAAERLTPFDAAQIRDALLDFSTADNLSRGAEGNVDRVVKLFAYVVRTITPQATGSAELPLTAYEAELLGRGSAEDRAWLFANLMRQLRIDSVILRPADAIENDPWWIAALLEGGIYLFDPVIGLPVPSDDASDVAGTLLPQPATWAEVTANPELLTAYRRAAGLEAQSIDTARLKSPRVELIGPESFWIQPMERLELSLTEDRGVLLYDPLHDTQAGGPGLVSRVVAAGGSYWTAEAIGLWPHTARVRQARADLPDGQKQRLRQRIEPYLGLVSVNMDGPTPVAEPPSRDLWQTRIFHMSGRPAPAIGSYQHIRLTGASPDPLLSPNDQSLNSKAADEAFYWTAQAQFDDEEYETAASTARNYIDGGGDRSDEAASLITLCLAAQGKTTEAAQAIDALPETTPGLPRLKWLADWWRGN